MKAANENRKVKYTKMVIRESLFELLETRPLNQITVKSLCELADINRGTFYSHYADIYDLVESLEDELIEKMMSDFRYESIGESNQKQMFTELCSHIKTNTEDYRILLLNPESSRCMDRILAETYKHHASTLLNKNPQLSLNMVDYSFAFLSSGGNKVILKWIENNFEEPPEEMARLINAFTDFGFAYLSSDN